MSNKGEWITPEIFSKMNGIHIYNYLCRKLEDEESMLYESSYEEFKKKMTKDNADGKSMSGSEKNDSGNYRYKIPGAEEYAATVEKRLWSHLCNSLEEFLEIS
jgi:recombinational DNA repair ATPase RecF